MRTLSNNAMKKIALAKMAPFARRTVAKHRSQWRYDYWADVIVMGILCKIWHE